MTDPTKRAADVQAGEEVFIPWVAHRRRAHSAWLVVKAVTELSNHSGPARKFHGCLKGDEHIPVSYTFAASEEVIYRASSHPEV